MPNVIWVACITGHTLSVGQAMAPTHEYTQLFFEYHCVTGLRNSGDDFCLAHMKTPQRQNERSVYWYPRQDQMYSPSPFMYRAFTKAVLIQHTHVGNLAFQLQHVKHTTMRPCMALSIMKCRRADASSKVLTFTSRSKE